MTRLTHAQRYERAGPTAMMATDAMQSLSFAALCDVLEAHIEARPDIAPDRLHDLGNKFGRRADAVEREAPA
jgi:hypothetical protein